MGLILQIAVVGVWVLLSLILLVALLSKDKEEKEKEEEKNYACLGCGEKLTVETCIDDENLILVSGCSLCEKEIIERWKEELEEEIIEDAKNLFINAIENVDLKDFNR